MSINDITGDSIVSKQGSTPLYDAGWEAIWGESSEDDSDEMFTCKFCGRPSKYPPEDQSCPPDYCHESDHGF